MSPDHQKVQQDTLRIVPALDWVERNGGVATQCEAIAKDGMPRIWLCFSRSKRLIRALHQSGRAQSEGRSYGSSGDLSHYSAQHEGVAIFWFESDPFWMGAK